MSSLRSRMGDEPQRPESDDQGPLALPERIKSAANQIGPASAEYLRGSPRGRAAATATADPYSTLKVAVHKACVAELGPELFVASPSESFSQRVRQVVAEQLAKDSTPLSREDRNRLIKEITDDILGLGPLEIFLRDDTVTEIMVNGHDQVFIEQAGEITRTAASFVDDNHLRRIIDKIVAQVGRRVDEGSPMVDARLPDGSRVNAIIPPLALNGPVLTIRKFARQPYRMVDLVELGTITADAAEFLAACVQGKLNILVTGGTGVGKTTMLNALSSFVGHNERIITIEDAAELQLQQPHVVRLESRSANIEGQGEVRIRDLVVNALRMRPDRIIVGEVRGAESLDMLQAMNTGHEGSLTTVHANSPRDALNRVEMLVLTAGYDVPLRSLREQVSRAFDLVIHLSRLANGSRRVMQIAEVLATESDLIQLQELFVARPPVGTPEGSLPDFLTPLTYTGIRPNFTAKLQARNVDVRLPKPEASAA